MKNAEKVFTAEIGRNFSLFCFRNKIEVVNSIEPSSAILVAGVLQCSPRPCRIPATRLSGLNQI
jgi:hypothetical protein